MANFPSELRYTKDHEWARLENGQVRVGITDHAVEQLGDVTLVDLPAKGFAAQAKKRFGDIESVKTVSELFAPASGEVVEVNEELNDKPELVNESPYEVDRHILIPATHPAERDELMTADAYKEYVAGLDH